MLAIQTSISLIWLPVTVILSAYAGYSFRSKQLKKHQRRITELEQEMLRNHAEILELNQSIASAKKKPAAVLSNAVVQMPVNEDNGSVTPGTMKKVLGEKKAQ